MMLLNEKRELLLQNVQTTGYGDVGGSMGLKKHFEDCARREVQEETGLICGNLEHFMNVSGEEVHYVYPNGDEIYAAEEISKQSVGQIGIDWNIRSGRQLSSRHWSARSAVVPFPC